MMYSTDNKKEFAQHLREEGDFETLDYIRMVAKEFGALPDDAMVLHLRGLKHTDDRVPHQN